MKRTFLFLFLITPLLCSAQWKNIVASDQIYAIAVHDTFLFVSGVESNSPTISRLSAKGGWPAGENVSKGIDPNGGNVTTFASLDSLFLAGSTPPNTGNGYISSDNGTTWTDPIGGPVGTNGTYIFAQYASRVARSRDGGQTWEHLSGPAGYSYASADSFVFAPTMFGNYRSTDSGGTWSAVTNAPLGLSFAAFARLDTRMFAGDSGLYRSSDFGIHWELFSLKNRIVNTLLTYKKYLFAGTDSGVYISFDSGVHWRDVSDGMVPLPHYNSDVTSLIVYDTMLFASTNDGVGSFGNIVSSVDQRAIREMTDTTQSGVRSVSLPATDTLEIYPNPSTGMVTIRAGGTSIVGITLLNVLGENMLNLPNIHQSDIALDLSRLPSGTYFVQIRTASGSMLRKIVKE